MSSSSDFIRAIAAGTKGVVRLHVARSPSIINATDSAGNSALHVAICRQRYGIASFLSKQGAKMSLQSAAALGDVETVLKELQRDPLQVTQRTADGWTAVHLACYYGHPEVLGVLLAFGASPHAKGPHGYCSPLHTAVVGGCESVVQLLLNQGGSLSERDAAGFNAIEIALLTGHEQICRRLEEARACRADKQNNSPLTMT